MAEWDEKMSLSDALKVLRSWREENKRRSKDVVDIWYGTLEKNYGKIGVEKYVVLEQVIFAALDTREEECFLTCMDHLRRDFGKSYRVFRYQTMKVGSDAFPLRAIEMLTTLIQRDETNAAARKHKVVVYKNAGDIRAAIDELTDYLKQFMSDAEAWQELCDLYLSEGEYSKAVFCAEELLLHQPHSHLFHQRIAEIRYTMGGTENLELAKSYYLQTLKLNANNVRALYGLYLTCCNLASQQKSGGSSKKKELVQTSQWALRQIKSKYESPGANAPHIEGPKSDEKPSDPVENLLGPLSALSMN